MNTVENQTKLVVDNFIKNLTLFTALDVSNEVKKDLPLARHREIRDVVRSLYNDMVTKGYVRTPIKVKLTDGSKVDALLYHHLSDSWDLDTKYDDQCRNATVAVKPALVNLPNTSPNQTVAVVSSVPVAVSAPSVSVPNNTQVNFVDSKDLWNNLFNGVKLFPLS